MLSRPVVGIYERSPFCRALMLDLLLTNDMVGVAARTPTELDGDGLNSLDRFDVLVVDFDSSSPETRQVIEAARALPFDEQPRIIALVTATNDAATLAAKRSAVDDVLHRPLDTGRFTRSVRRQAMVAKGLAK